MSAESLKEIASMLLQNVLDPELGISIVDLGLVYGVDIEDSTLTVTMTLTTPGCPLHDTLTDAVQRTLERTPGVEKVQVDLVWQPAWSPERITPEGKRLLGWR